MKISAQQTLIKVKLNRHGLDILRTRYEHSQKMIRIRGGATKPWRNPVTDDHGYSTCTLVELLIAFSSAIAYGNMMPFDDAIIVPDAEEMPKPALVPSE